MPVYPVTLFASSGRSYNAIASCCHWQCGRSLRRRNISLRHIVILLTYLAIQGAFSPLRAEPSKKYYKDGKNAELREDYITAYQDYRQAWLQKPEDMKYKESYSRLRPLAAFQYIDLGHKLRDEGQLNDALTDFLRAFDIDPGNEAAHQDITRTRSLIDKAAASQPNPDAVSVTSEQDQQDLQSLGRPLRLKPLSDEPITIHMVADAKVAYETIGKIAGINIVFDPDYTSKRIPIDLNGVTLSGALRTISYISQTFWTPITTDTILVAADTRQKRTELEAQAVQTFYLGNVTQANDLNEVLNAVRNLMDTTVKMQAVPSQNAIVMRGTPGQLLLAQKIIDDLDRAKPEVVVDVAVMSVNKDLLRNIGLQLPGSIGVQLQSSTASSTTSSSTTSSSSSSTNSLTLNDLGNINATNFGITIGAATLNMLLTDSDTRVLQNPQLRIVDGEKATLKIGEKIPIATGSYGSTLTAATSSIVSTQFSYIDVGVTMEVQPTIHYDGDVSMKVHIVVSSVLSYTTIDSITQPVIGQQDLQQVIRTKEGTDNLLGGILQHTDSLTVGGTPGLGEIPILKYLFSSQEKETVNNEIVFLLVPHLVRRIDITPLNLRTVDTGTGTNVTLRMDPTAYGKASQGAVKQTDRTGSDPAAAAINGNGSGPEPSSTVESGSHMPKVEDTTTISSEPRLQLSMPPDQSVEKVGSTFKVKVGLIRGKDLFSVPMHLHFDSRLLSLVNINSGTLLESNGQPPALVHREDGNGNLIISTSRPPGTHGVSGNGDLCVLTFQAKAAGEASIQITKSAVLNSEQAILANLAATPLVVHIQ
jgi:general secretion pathway protein D